MKWRPLANALHSLKAVLAPLRDTHGCIRKANLCLTGWAFPFKYTTWSIRDARSFSNLMVLWVVSRLCFSSKRAKRMCAYRAGTPKQKGRLWGSSFRIQTMGHILQRTAEKEEGTTPLSATNDQKALRRRSPFGEKYMCAFYFLNTFRVANFWKETFQ